MGSVNHDLAEQRPGALEPMLRHGTLFVVSSIAQYADVLHIHLTGFSMGLLHVTESTHTVGSGCAELQASSSRNGHEPTEVVQCVSRTHDVSGTVGATIAAISAPAMDQKVVDIGNLIHGRNPGTEG